MQPYHPEPAMTLKVGLIGLDTSHVPAFTRILNDTSLEHHVPGARVVAGYPGAVDDFEPSYSRVEKFTSEIRDDFNVEILDSPRDVADRVDLVFITSVDGRTHRRFMEEVAPAGKPVFLDKPLACSLEDAARIFAIASEHNIAVMGCSNHRYADPLQHALALPGRIEAAATFGPMAVHDQVPGFYWYGVHQIEMVVAALGPGAATVQVDTSENHDVATIQWNDGRVAIVHGQRDIHKGFGITLHRADGAQMIDTTKTDRPRYAAMLERIIDKLPRGESDIPPEQSLTIMAIIDAANESRASGGKTIPVADVTAMA